MSFSRRTLWGVFVFGALLILSGMALQTVDQDEASEGTLKQKSYAEQTDRLIVKFRSPLSSHTLNRDRLDGLSTRVGVELIDFRAMSGGAHVLKLPREMPLPDVIRIARRLQYDTAIEYAEPDRRVWPVLVPNDPRYAEQWHFFEDAGGVGLPAAWDTTTGDPNLVVAVLDTGILFNHPDLAGRTLPGFDFISNFGGRPNDGDGRDPDAGDPGNWVDASESSADCSPIPSTWHGTHVAGTIAAATDNNVGVAGINWNSKLLPLRVLGKCGGFFSDVADAMRWAVGMNVPGVPPNPNPAKVLNLSLSAPTTLGCPELLQGPVNDVVATGAVVVAGVGNDNVDAANATPANCDGVIAVGATTRSGSRAPYSNFGSRVDISAPGGADSEANGILSTLNNGTTVPAANTYRVGIGTSFAASHVSGIVSLVLSANPGLSPAQVLDTIKTTARAFTDGSCTTTTCGAGIINAAAAVQAAATAANSVPVAANGSLTTDEDSAVNGVLEANDADGDDLTFSIVTNGTLGSAVITNVAMGAFTYSPNAGATGADSFTFKVNDGRVDSAPATVRVTINSTPVASDGSLTTDENQSATGTLNATDADGNDLTFSTVTNGTKGQVTITDPASGAFTYSPNAGATGADSFTFKVNDGRVDSASATVSVTINAAATGDGGTGDVGDTGGTADTGDTGGTGDTSDTSNTTDNTTNTTGDPSGTATDTVVDAAVGDTTSTSTDEGGGGGGGAVGLPILLLNALLIYGYRRCERWIRNLH